MPEEAPKNGEKFTTGQKFVFGILLLFGVAVLSLGFLQIAGNINGPFKKNTPSSSSGTEQPKTALEEAIEMKNADTDGDGISDYDETYIYNTSIYLDDSDSDGISDSDEIAGGTDPSCPEGKDCSSSDTALDAEAEGQTGADPNDLMNIGLNSNEAFSLPQESGSSVDQAEALRILQDASPDELRQMLIEAGMEKEVLDGIDDDTLMKTYEDALANMAQ